jgi:hypothetical protein
VEADDEDDEEEDDEEEEEEEEEELALKIKGNSSPMKTCLRFFSESLKQSLRSIEQYTKGERRNTQTQTDQPSIACSASLTSRF